MELSFIASVFKPFPLLCTPFPPSPKEQGGRESKTVEQTGKIHLLLQRTYLGNYFIFFFLKQSPIHLLAHRI
jgi:hypothetical protein